MNLFFRLFIEWLGSLRRPRLGVLDTSAVTLRVWPGDLDLWGHVNNGVYLSLADLGRFDLMVRCGLFGLARKNKWALVQGAATVVFRKPLTLFQQYTLLTRVMSWDEKWIYLESRFERGGALIALIIVRALARSSSGNIATSEVISGLGTTVASPQLAPQLQQSFEQFAALTK